MLEISVIIVNWNGMSYLPGCLTSLSRQTYQDFEAIVVDNGSTDGSAAYVRAEMPWVRLIQNRKNVGYCRGNNIGCEDARGSYLLLLNSDAELAPDALEHLLAAARSDLPSWLGLAPKIVFRDETFFINSLGVHWHHLGHWRDIRVGRMDLGRFPDHELIFGAIFPAIFLHADRFRELGRFDERFFSYDEDFDVCYRANICGYKFYTVPSAVIKHAYRSSIRSPQLQRWHTYLYTRNYLMVFLKNYQRQNLIKYGRQILRRYLLAPVKRAIERGSWSDVSPYLRAAVWLLLCLPLIMKKRLPLQHHRRIPDRELWNYSPVEETNLFHFNGSPVMSLLALRTALNERQEYQADGNSFVTV